MRDEPIDTSAFRRARPSLHLTRFLLLRGLGGVFAVAFAVALLQNPALIGERGLTPASLFVERYAGMTGGLAEAFWARPSLFFLTGASDAALGLAAGLGLALSLAVLLGLSWGPAMALLWALYLSLVQVGQEWTGYGWETLLCEAGFLAIFLAPWRDWRPLSARSPPSELVIWLYRWLTVRLMLGAGLIKLRGDPCWTDLSCLQFHYETQPIPHPLSWAWHQLPDAVLSGGVLVNHVVELVVPLLLFAPRPWRSLAGAALAAFQLSLILSGNLAFLNWLTLVIGLSGLEDPALLRALPMRLRARAEAWLSARRQAPPHGLLHRARPWALAPLAGLVALLSLEPVANMLSPDQRMNSSFDRLHLVNSYGAFGSVGRTREAVVVQVQAGPGEPWLDWPWACQPVAEGARPCWLTPYHLRLDWQAWFLPFAQVDDNPWFVHLLAKLLHGDALLIEQMGESPLGDMRPHRVRARRVRLRFVAPGQAGWWVREDLGEYARPLGRDDPALTSFIARYGWEVPTDEGPR